MNHAVIFGGSGFIGQHLVESLVSKGISVTVADLTQPRSKNELIDFQRVDVRNRIELEKSVPPNSVVYNLAAVHRTPGHPEHEYYETNVLGALNITAWAAATQIESICFTSSIAVYGPSETTKNEFSLPLPNTAYGRSKLLAERIHQSWREAKRGRQLVIVRPAVIFGPGENGNFTKLADALKRRRFFYPGRDDTVKACGYISDFVRALDFGLQQQQGRDGVQLLLSGQLQH